MASKQATATKKPPRSEGRSNTLTEPSPPFPKQHQQSPGLESRMTPRPKYQAERYKAAGKLKGKRALITGGDSGIGRAVAVLFAREGADVGIVYLPQEQSDADETQRAVEAEGRQCVQIPGDLIEEQFCREAVERTLRDLGGLDILVSNAAYQHRKEDLEDVTDEEWDRTFKVNVYAYFRLVKFALRHLKEGSAIIATSSETGLEGAEKLFDYSATKGAINALTKTLAMELVDRQIRVNAVAPGPVWTPLNIADRGQPPEKVSVFGQKTPMGRPAQPEELAPAYVFLASESDSSYITGEILTVMGGQTTAG